MKIWKVMFSSLFVHISDNCIMLHNAVIEIYNKLAKTLTIEWIYWYIFLFEIKSVSVWDLLNGKLLNSFCKSMTVVDYLTMWNSFGLGFQSQCEVVHQVLLVIMQCIPIAENGFCHDRKQFRQIRLIMKYESLKHILILPHHDFLWNLFFCNC